MKMLEQLGISPAPWYVEENKEVKNDRLHEEVEEV